jgi:hypothetical protein
MSKSFKNLIRTSLAAWMLLLSATFSPATPANPPADPTAEALHEQPYCGEVRMRRLHLVRPDLIKYPIAVEVYC